MLPRPELSRRRFLGGLGAALAPCILGAGPAAGDHRVSTALRRGVEFLCRRQEDPGHWPSPVYGAFKDGSALTPLITVALAGHDSPSPVAQKALNRARDWLAEHGDAVLGIYPVHNASWLLQGGIEGELADAGRDRLLSLQLTRKQGWDRSHPQFGGWSYAPKPGSAGTQLAPFQEPNLSATALAIDGLHAAGFQPDHPALAAARKFLDRCQNPDGGFFETGPSAVGDPQSYTSATADGLRALLHCGAAWDDPAPRAALAWLKGHANPGDAPDLRYYASASLAATARLLSDALAESRPTLCRDLAASQEEDGSWHNPAPEMREDDPLVATALAVLALKRSRPGPDSVAGR